MTATTTGRARSLGRVQGMPLQRWLTTTPGRLRVASIAVVAGLVLLAVVAVSAIASRHAAADDLSIRTVPALVSAEKLYGSLADADATASRIFLEAGLEPEQLRGQYHDDLQRAGRELAGVADAAVISPGAQRAVRTITTDLPVYTELVGEARFNSRQGYPVGARYLHDASTLMREEVLPAATAIFQDASARLDDNYGAGTSSRELFVVGAAGLLLVALLGGVQVYVARRSRRIFNVPLLAATVLVVVVTVGILVQFALSAGSLDAARDDGSDTVQLAAAARILTLRGAADESFALIERGGGDAFLADFKTLVPRVRRVLALAQHTGAAAARDGAGTALHQYDDFVAAHHDIAALDDGGQYKEAVRASTTDQAGRVTTLDRTYSQLVSEAQDHLASKASHARSGFGVSTIVIPLLLVGAVALVLVGLQRRIREYR